jgi:hypothetical protein
MEQVRYPQTGEEGNAVASIPKRSRGNADTQAIAGEPTTGQTLGFYYQGESAGFIGAVVGAMILLAAYRMISRRRIAQRFRETETPFLLY